MSSGRCPLGCGGIAHDDWCDSCGELPKPLSPEEKIHRLFAKMPEKDRVKIVVDEMRTWKERDGAYDSIRMDVIHSFCRGCGSNDSSCQCWNDE